MDMQHRRYKSEFRKHINHQDKGDGIDIPQMLAQGASRGENCNQLKNYKAHANCKKKEEGGKDRDEGTKGQRRAREGE
eukprot:3250764-Heterocapsa_arctica.AAC.1